MGSVSLRITAGLSVRTGRTKEKAPVSGNIEAFAINNKERWRGVRITSGEKRRLSHVALGAGVLVVALAVLRSALSVS